MSAGPLVALFSQHHDPSGILPADLLVEAAAESGHRAIALLDLASLRSAPSFLEACRKCSVHPLLGMTLAISLHPERDSSRHRDVFDLIPGGGTEGPRNDHEWVSLLALDPVGLRRLVSLGEKSDNTPDRALPLELLAESTEGLHLILGPPGSILERVVSGRRSWGSARYLEPLLSLFPPARTSFGGLYIGPDDRALALRVSRLEKLPVKVAPLAVQWTAYRNDRDRFWGLAKATLSEIGPPYDPDSSLILENPSEIQVALQGMSGALSRVGKISHGETDLSRHYHSAPPSYPSPRGTDTHSFFWTLGQETAISTGHINRPEYKDRLYEEFQFFKQTDWPTLFLFLWDLRRRVGLPPGTLRVSEDWIATSLFAHILGLSRVDPIRSGLPFHSRPLECSPRESLVLEVECPHGWEKHLLTAAEESIGDSKATLLKDPPHRPSLELLRAGTRILSSWEELGFAGNRPEHPPSLPRHLSEDEDSGDSSLTLHLSGRAIGFLPSDDDSGSRVLAFDAKDRRLLGGLNLVLRPNPLLTLATSGRYRGIPETGDPAKPSHESVTDWIELHEGRVYYGKPYADDSGPFEIMGMSASFARLLTLPESMGYRPLLWKWIVESPPSTLSDLADLLALAHLWSFWSKRPVYRARAFSKPFEETSSANPPWWDYWEEFSKRSSLNSRIASRLSTCLEKETRGTGGWVLYRETLDRALVESLGWNAAKIEEFLILPNDPEALEEEEDFHPFNLEDRRGFLEFLGHPNPLPSRVAFLRKAADILAAIDGFLSDPAAWGSLTSYLYPQELDERRTLYRILKDMGCDVRVPRHSDSIPFAMSREPRSLTLGLTDLFGVGPQIASELSKGRRYRTPHDLFVSHPEIVESSGFTAWLRKTDHLLHLHLVENLIHLGFFDRFGSDRIRLLDQARTRFQRKREKQEALQQTLFQIEGLPLSTDPFPSRETEGLEPKKPIEWELSGVRMPLSGTPLRRFGGEIPNRWIETDKEDLTVSGIRIGWVYDVEVFALPTTSDRLEESRAPDGLSVHFLLHTENGACLVEDREGNSLAVLPDETIPEPRLDGHRIHLRDPLCLVVDTVPKPTKGNPRIPAYRSMAVESIADLVARQEIWAGVRVIVEDPKPVLFEEIEKLAGFFSLDLGESSVLLEVAGPDSLNPITLLRRKRKVFHPQAVVASEVLVSRLRQTPGVSNVEIVPRQTPLFKPEEE